MCRESAVKRIKKNFILLLQTKELHEIKVAQLCKLAEINRSTFYAHFIDIYDLSEKITAEIEDKYLYMVNLAGDNVGLKQAFFELFADVKKNPKIYQAYFKINPTKGLLFKEHDETTGESHNDFLKYNSIFFRTGITAVVKLWLENVCEESIEEMTALVLNKYSF
ncbi:TetR/AcrR family transcriptional regulator [Enterococcus sp. AZ072]|uniref:TetR/AcrR family transcriptional regulator n=1 Tax=unclassified Enterococcus TaxID=2608891 RepID=UPI003D2E7D18